MRFLTNAMPSNGSSGTSQHLTATRSASQLTGSRRVSLALIATSRKEFDSVLHTRNLVFWNVVAYTFALRRGKDRVHSQGGGGAGV